MVIIMYTISKMHFVKELSIIVHKMRELYAIPHDIETCLAIDRSISMERDFSKGTITVLIDIILAIAIVSNIAKKLKMFFFNTSVSKFPDATFLDSGIYLRDHPVTIGGATNLHPVVTKLLGRKPKLLRHLFNRVFRIKPKLRHVIVITDGDCFDRNEFELYLAMTPVAYRFMQILGISNRIDNEYLSFVARNYPNVAFDYIDIDQIKPEEILEKVFNQKFINWLKKPRDL